MDVERFWRLDDSPFPRSASCRAISGSIQHTYLFMTKAEHWAWRLELKGVEHILQQHSYFRRVSTLGDFSACTPISACAPQQTHRKRAEPADVKHSVVAHCAWLVRAKRARFQARSALNLNARGGHL